MGYGVSTMTTASSSFQVTGDARIGFASIFDGLDLRLFPGEWIGLLGPSGVGKSTALKLLAGLADHVTFEGDLTLPPAGSVAMMGQDDLLLPWLTVAQNVALGARLRREKVNSSRVSEILEQVGLGAFANRKPGSLSGGQRQRAALARTLMEDRPVILLDEPFSALDALTRLQMQDLTAELLRQRTVLLVTHDPGEAVRMSDRIVIMRAAGITKVRVPAGPTPRAVDAPDVMQAQAELLSQLRAEHI